MCICVACRLKQNVQTNVLSVKIKSTVIMEIAGF